MKLGSRALLTLPLLLFVAIVAGPRMQEGGACPRCGDGRIVRRRLRIIDRAITKFRPVRRIACMKCRWTGRVRVNEHQRAKVL